MASAQEAAQNAVTNENEARARTTTSPPNMTSASVPGLPGAVATSSSSSITQDSKNNDHQGKF